MDTYRIRTNEQYPKLNGAVIALGSFDGVHRGHQKIIQTAQALAQKYKKPMGIITYMPIPQVLLYKDFHFLLNTDKEKINILKGLEIDFLGRIKFSRELMNLGAREYILEYIVKTIKPSAIVVGVDHHFGKEHKGNVALLKTLGREFDFEVKVVPSLKYHSIPVKSTRIRELVILGNMKRVKELLGRPYSIAGKVIKGKGLARHLGFPTLNLHVLEKAKLVPADGVHHIKALFDRKEYNGVMNIGFAPTIANKFRAYQMRSLEVHLFCYTGTEKTALGKEITVEFYNHLRPEKKFDNLDELKKQIAEDVRKVKTSLR